MFFTQQFQFQSSKHISILSNVSVTDASPALFILIYIKMLKSHFNLSQGNDDEEQIETVAETISKKKKKKRIVRESVDTPGEEQLEEWITEGEEEQEEYVRPEEEPSRKLSKSEISVRLSMLGKTADGDG